MVLEELRAYCLEKRGVSEAYPFDDETLVIKVGSKMFVLTNIKTHEFKINLKCEPALAVALRQEYDGITAGYHMNKVHWNTVKIDGRISDEKIKFLIDLSYDLVFKGLNKTEKEGIILSLKNL